MSNVPMSEVPTLAHVLQTLAYHLSCIMTDRPVRTDEPYANRSKFGLGLGGWDHCSFVHTDVTVTPSATSEDKWGPWAQVELPQIGYRGNRCGARDAYAKACTPVVQWVVGYWAAREVKP